MSDRTAQTFAQGLLSDTERIFSEQLKWVVNLLNHNPELANILNNEEIPVPEKKNLLDEVVRDHIDAQTYNMVLMLASSGRINLISSVQQEFERLASRRVDEIEGLVESAFQLDEAMMNRLEKHFSAIMAQPVRLKLQINENLIGGVLVIIGDQVFDGTIKRKLDMMGKHILKS